MRKIILLFLLACFLTCINNEDENNYGAVELDLLTKLTWSKKGNEYAVEMFYLVSQTDSTGWLLRPYFCRDATCDTFFRDDTMSGALSLNINQDTVEFLNNVWPPKKAKITKLNENELIMKYIDISTDVFKYYKRNHKVLVTKGISTGTETIDYRE